MVIVLSECTYLWQNRLQGLGVLLVLLVYRSVHYPCLLVYVRSSLDSELTVVVLELIMDTVVDVLTETFREVEAKALGRANSPSSSGACSPCMIPSF